jgi:hypothetical protein
MDKIDVSHSIALHRVANQLVIKHDHFVAPSD